MVVMPQLCPLNFSLVDDMAATLLTGLHWQWSWQTGLLSCWEFARCPAALPKNICRRIQWITNPTPLGKKTERSI